MNDHPRAAEILDDPFYWDEGDDFAPNGNDTGSDILAEYQEWVPQYSQSRPLFFLKQLVLKWGYPDFETMDSTIRCEAVIGLAFAELKLRATCNESIRLLALKAIDLQRAEAPAAYDGILREQRLKALDQLESKLKRKTNWEPQ